MVERGSVTAKKIEHEYYISKTEFSRIKQLVESYVPLDVVISELARETNSRFSVKKYNDKSAFVEMAIGEKWWDAEIIRIAEYPVLNYAIEYAVRRNDAQIIKEKCRLWMRLYWYETGIDCLDERAIGESKRQFEELREKGVIQSAQYQSLVWQMYDGVHMPMSLSFALNEVVFVQRGTQLFGCSLYDYQQTMRVVVTSKMGMSISWLQTLCVALRSMADRGEQFEVERYAAHAEVMQDFLTLLPGDSGFRRCLIDKLDELRLKNKMAQRQQRVLLDYKSYIIFDHYLKKFWSTAKQEEKVLYFPVWFWWHITVIIPLRPTECVLTPRACIKEERGKYYLAIRRTKLKGTTMGCEYSLEKDYSIEEFEVPEIFAHEIKDYIRATDREFVADIDSLFSKANQFTELKQWRKRM